MKKLFPPALKPSITSFRRILTSGQGKEEHEASNNPSVAYDAQVIAFAMYAGNKTTASRFIKEFPEFSWTTHILKARPVPID